MVQDRPPSPWTLLPLLLFLFFPWTLTKGLIPQPVGPSTLDCQPAADFRCGHVVPQRTVRLPVKGCYSREQTSKGQEIHLLSWEPTEDGNQEGVVVGGGPQLTRAVSLEFSARHPRRGGVVLILYSPVEHLAWSLDRQGLTASDKLTILVRTGNKVVFSDGGHVTWREVNSTSMSELMSWIRFKRFRALTTFTSVTGADRLTLPLGIDPFAPTTCNLESMEEPPSVAASRLVYVPCLLGCSPPQATTATILSQSSFIYVIELGSEGSGVSASEVYVEVRKEGASLWPVPALPVNLVLILKCQSTVRWRLRAPPSVQGTLLVVSDQVVITETIPTSLVVRAQLAAFPAGLSTQGLLDWTLDHYGPVSSYTSVNNANLFSIILPSRKPAGGHQSRSARKLPTKELARRVEEGNKDQGLPYRIHSEKQVMHAVNTSGLPGWPTNVTLLSIKMINNETLKTPDRIPRASLQNNLTRQLAVYMSWQCLEKTVVITFRKEGVEAALDTPEGALQLTLRNRNCRAILNATHYVLSYPLTSCGSQKKQKSNTDAYTNQVYFWRQDHHSGELTEVVSSHMLTHQDEEPETEGSGGGSDVDHFSNPILLHYMNFQGSCNTTLQYPNNNNIDSGEESGSIFLLQLFHSREFLEPFSVRTNHPFEAVEYSFIYVQASRQPATDSSLCVSVEDCWLSDTRNSHSDHNKRNVLIRNSCPTDLSVQFLNPSRFLPCRRRFSFQLNSDFVEQNLYLHCRLVACQHTDHNSSTPSEQPGLRKCADPEEFCIKQSLRPFLDTPHYKHSSIEVRGPIRVVPKHKACKDKDNSMSSNNWQQTEASASSKKASVVVLGLPTEAVVGVAVASFLIGAGLTALLWFIHHRTDPRRGPHVQGKHLGNNQNQMHVQNQSVITGNHQSGYDLSGHSGSSTPSSQAPMTLQVVT